MAIEKFVEWFQSLPVDHRNDIAASVGTFCPGYKFDLMADDLPKEFIEALTEKTVTPFHIVAALTGIRDWIQIFFIDQRSDKKGWESTKKELETLAEVTGSETFNESAQQAELRGRQWLVTCEKWNELLKNHLSNDHLTVLLHKK